MRFQFTNQNKRMYYVHKYGVLVRVYDRLVDREREVVSKQIAVYRERIARENQQLPATPMRVSSDSGERTRTSSYPLFHNLHNLLRFCIC